MKHFLAVLTAVGMVACGGNAATQDTGSIELSISGPRAASSGFLRSALVAGASGTADAASGIKSVWVSFESAETGYYGDFQRVQLIDGGQFPIEHVMRTKLEAGTYTVTAYAYEGAEGGTVLYSSSANVVVSDRRISAVSLIMQQKVAPGTVAVTAPMITAITVTGTYPPAIGKPVHLEATVNGPPTSTYEWKVSCPGDWMNSSFPFSAPASLATDLTLHSCEADAVVTFRVTSLVEGVSAPLQAAVSFVLRYAPQGVEVEGITINSWPNVVSISTGSNTQPMPGEDVALAATVSDPDGDALSFGWSDNCGGTFDDSTSPTPVWTAPMMPGQQCVLTLAVDEVDGLGHNAATFTLQVATPILTVAPYIDVCTPGVWTCKSVASYAGAESYVDTAGVHLVKTVADSSSIAFGPNAGILGVAGMTFSSATFDATGTGIGAGTPRFYLRFQSGAPCALDAPVVAGTTFTFTPTASCGAGTLSGLDIIADMGGGVGDLTIANIVVNGITVVL